MAERRYYWAKLKQDFLEQKAVRYLRRQEHGDTLVLIYLKLILITLNHEGVFYFDDYGNDLYEEMAISLDENEEDCVRAVKALTHFNLIEWSENEDKLIIKGFDDMVGSETGSAKRVRDFRNHQKQNKSILDD